MDTAVRQHRASAYKSVAAWSSVADNDPQRLIQMLYDGALERIAMARGCMLNRQLAEKAQLLTRVIAIVGELRGSLDLRAHGRTVEVLRNDSGFEVIAGIGALVLGEPPGSTSAMHAACGASAMKL